MPDVPSMRSLAIWISLRHAVGVVAPAGTPAAIVARLNATINDGLRSPESRASFGQARNER